VFADDARRRALARQLVLTDVGHVQDALGTHQAVAADDGPLRLGPVGDRADGPALFEHGRRLLQDFRPRLGVGVAAAGVLPGLLERRLGHDQVRQDQFVLQSLDVAHGVDGTGTALEAPYDLADRVHLADVGQ
jgi:hypothetical protein